MNELENLVKSVVYGGIGAAATIVEKGGDIARALVEKGHETVKANQGTVDQIKETAKEAAEDIKETAEEITGRLANFCDRLLKDGVIDVSCLNRQQRDAMRQQLDEQDELDRQAAEACVYDEEIPAQGMAVPTIEVEEEAPAEEPTQVQAVPTIEVVEEAPAEAPISDDDVPVFEPEQPTYTVPDEE